MIETRKGKKSSVPQPTKPIKNDNESSMPTYIVPESSGTSGSESESESMKSASRPASKTNDLLSSTASSFSGSDVVGIDAGSDDSKKTKKTPEATGPKFKRGSSKATKKTLEATGPKFKRGSSKATKKTLEATGPKFKRGSSKASRKCKSEEPNTDDLNKKPRLEKSKPPLRSLSEADESLSLRLPSSQDIRKTLERKRMRSESPSAKVKRANTKKHK